MIRRYKFLSIATVIALATILISATVKSNGPVAACVIPEKQNVFYIGVDNPINVGIAGIAASNVIVAIDNGTVTATARPGVYIVRVESFGHSKISVSYRDNGQTFGAGQYTFRNKKIPDPVTYIGSIRNEGVMLKSNLQLISGVFTRMENFDFDCAFRPQSFSMEIFHDSIWTEYSTTGPALNAEMKLALHNAMPEDRIVFHKIQTLGPDSTLRLVNPVYITVK